MARKYFRKRTFQFQLPWCKSAGLKITTVKQGRTKKDILLDVMTPKDLVADQSQPMDRWINMRAIFDGGSTF